MIPPIDTGYEALIVTVTAISGAAILLSPLLLLYWVWHPVSFKHHAVQATIRCLVSAVPVLWSLVFLQESLQPMVLVLYAIAALCILAAFIWTLYSTIVHRSGYVNIRLSIYLADLVSYGVLLVLSWPVVLGFIFNWPRVVILFLAHIGI